MGTLGAALLTYAIGSAIVLPLGQLLAITAGFFIYVAASDIIPDIHEQPRRVGTMQAAVLVVGLVGVGLVIQLLGA